MGQPAFWILLAATAFLGIGTRMVVRRPLWRQRSSELPPRDLAMAVVMVVVLIFHCAAMFFADFVDALPGAKALASAVRDLGLVSQVLYWVSAAALTVALRRIWPPALALLTIALVGVGYTMFVPHSLTSHLAWIAGAAISLVMIAVALVGPLRRATPTPA